VEILEIFEQKEALLRGHFLLSSGLHSDKYIQCALVLQYPDIAEKIAKLLVEKFVSDVSTRSSVDLVVSPAIGGIVIGQEIARVLNCRVIFCERDSRGKFILKRGFSINKDDKVLVVEDVITTGGSTKEVIEVVENNNGKTIAVLSIVDRSEGKVNFEIPKVSLLSLDIKTFSPDQCPLCKEKIQLVKPGSRNR